MIEGQEGPLAIRPMEDALSTEVSIATCSTSGFIAYPMLGLYSASKFGIRGLMTSLRAELIGSNVDVSIVCPGEVTTNIVNSTFKSTSKQKTEPRTEDLDEGRPFAAAGMTKIS